MNQASYFESDDLVAPQDEDNGSSYPLKMHPVHILMFALTALTFLYVVYAKCKSRRQQLARQRFLNDPAAQERARQQILQKEQEQCKKQEKSWFILIEQNHLSTVLTGQDFQATKEETGVVESKGSLCLITAVGTKQEQDSGDRDDADIELGNIVENKIATSTESSSKASSLMETPSESTTTLDTLAQNCGKTITIPTKNEEKRIVSDVCAICLERYSPGDEIVWSNNAQCQHVFHQECLLDYFRTMVKKKQAEERPQDNDLATMMTIDQNNDRSSNGEESNPIPLQTTCPCCRQDFFVLSAQSKPTKWK